MSETPTPHTPTENFSTEFEPAENVNPENVSHFNPLEAEAQGDTALLERLRATEKARLDLEALAGDETASQQDWITTRDRLAVMKRIADDRKRELGIIQDPPTDS